MKTGENADCKLLFRGKANQLANIFRQLYDAKFIIVGSKKELQGWVVVNFSYLKDGKEEMLKYETVDKTISRNDQPCKNPVISIIDGKIQLLRTSSK